MDIIIPTKLLNLINGLTDDISAAVGSAVSSVSPILKRNESPFFPNYTDHGIQHVNNVLKTCELIISEDSWSFFTRQDAATLILAVLAHDLGMLISIENFRYLVNPNNNFNLPIDTNDKSWHKLWREYQLTTQRFDGATLKMLLGSPEPIPIQELNPNNFTERGLIIVGEFIRRHHHRLAHEIVKYGILSENGSTQLFHSIPQHLIDIAGLVARSHGISFRNCLELLRKLDRTGHREYRQIHPTFLMAIVRLADYLDLDHGRAPSSVLSAKSLKSPISHREWWSHKALVDCHSLADDPESLHVVIETTQLPNIETFLTIEDKIGSIQNELDSCWAVLGEVYGRFPPLNRLSLRIRRIRSDLRSKTIIDQLPFIPHKASLETSKSDLLKLFIAPLYGNNPGIGVRELLQNPIDAVRELEFTLNDSPSLGIVDQEEIKGDVVVKFEKDSEDNIWIVINDRGIGMTWETICKYYLTAGASFRNSDAWKKNFTNETGESQILRSGRFGIGILAAFLLGNRVQVSTRYIDEPENHGVFFEFGLDDTTIELKWKNRKVGTTIKIKTSQEIVDKLAKNHYYRMEWFCLKKSEVILQNIDGKKIRQKIILPEEKGDLPFDHHSIKVLGYNEIQWTYSKDNPGLICNGIFITKYKGVEINNVFHRRSDARWYSSDLSLDDPQTSVFDSDGLLPLNLARDDLMDTPKNLSSAITDDVCRNLIAFSLLRGPKTRLLSDSKWHLYTTKYYPGCNNWDNNSSFFFDTSDGFGLCDPWNLSFFPNGKRILLRIQGKQYKIPQIVADLIHTDYNVVYGEATANTLREFDRWHRSLVLYDDYYERLFVFNELNIAGINTLTSIKWYERLLEKLPKFAVNKIKNKKQIGDWVIMSLGKYPNSKNSLVSIANKLFEHNIPFESITECFYEPNIEKPKPSILAKMWQKEIGGPIIPFNEKERQRIIDNLDSKFKRHLAEWNQE
jgi:hypothetical protein